MIKASKVILSLSVFTFVILSGLNSQASDIQDIETGQINGQNATDLTPRTVEGWNAHLNSIKNRGPLQEGCEPFYKLTKGKSKGTVLLFHGYTACPYQQYIELSSMLTEKGYNVFVPLLPGHGKIALKTDSIITDQTSELPDEKSAFIYKNFAQDISAIFKDEPGLKVVGGLSLGGVMAASAMITNPDIYDRGFILAPFFNAAGIYGALIPTLGKLFPERQISWGEECEKQRKMGRAGYCNFRVANILAIQSFGADTLNKIAEIKKTVQVSGVEKDNSASNSLIAEANQRLANKHGCFFAEGSSHSMLSHYDNVGIDMFWLKPLLRQVARFVDTGRRFEEVGESEYGMKKCISYEKK